MTNGSYLLKFLPPPICALALLFAAGFLELITAAACAGVNTA